MLRYTLLSLYSYVSDGRSYDSTNNTTKYFLTSYHYDHKNNHLSDSLILHSVPFRRAAIARRKHCQSSSDFCRIEIQRLRRAHSHGHVTKHRYLIERTCFLTVHDIPRVYDACNPAWKFRSHLYHPAHKNAAIIYPYWMNLENDITFPHCIYSCSSMNPASDFFESDVSIPAHHRDDSGSGVR